MLPLDETTQERLSRQAASLCTAWRITRSDGDVLALTDHDHDITFSGVTFKSVGGLEGTSLEGGVALSPDNADIIGMFREGVIEHEALIQGRLDHATVEVFRVDWEAPEHRLLIRKGTLGEVDFDGVRFTAEFRSLKHQLDTPAGRVYGRSCDARLGGERCGVDLSHPLYTLNGTVTESHERQIYVDFSSVVEAGWFDYGRMVVKEGVMAGLSRSIFRHTVTSDGDKIEFWQALPSLLTLGTAVTLIAGCDKSHTMCTDKFQNSLNFQGFPDIPGTDALIAYPVPRDELT